MEPSNWAPEHSDALREYLALGMSYSEIARAINAKFNTAYSRNAAIGRAKRMGLAGTDRPGDWTPPAPRDQRPSLRRLREHYAAASRWSGRCSSGGDRQNSAASTSNRAICRCWNSKPGDCRYPYGGDEEGEAITFCGHPRREDSSYCAAHFHLTRGPGAAPERAVSAAPLRIVEAA